VFNLTSKTNLLPPDPPNIVKRTSYRYILSTCSRLIILSSMIWLYLLANTWFLTYEYKNTIPSHYCCVRRKILYILYRCTRSHMHRVFSVYDDHDQGLNFYAQKSRNMIYIQFYKPITSIVRGLAFWSPSESLVTIILYYVQHNNYNLQYYNM